jgi:hypothetical protein
MPEVIITRMSTGKEDHREFITYKDAYQFFLNWCIERNYEHDDNATEAGGTGYDYRIEVKP